MLSILNYITWDVSPFIYEGDHFAIGWYGVLITLSSLALLCIFLYIFKKENQPTQYAFLLFLVTSVMTYFMAHIFHCVFYEWYYYEDDPIHLFGTQLYWRNPMLEHPWTLLNIAQGGFASHGCVFGALVGAIFLRKGLSCSFYWLFDRIMIGSCNMLFVRIGNLMSGEIYGVTTTLPWGFVFNGETLPAHPTQIYEIAYFLVAFIVGIVLLFRTNAGKYKGFISGLLLLLIFVPRFVIEFWKLPQADFETGWLFNMGQLLSIPYIIWGVYMLVRSIQQGPQTNIAPMVTLNHKQRKQLKNGYKR